MSSLACIVVLYNPSCLHMNSLSQMLSSGLEMILYNNSCDSQLLDQLDADGANILGDGSNIGLSRAYNTCCLFALERGFTHALMLDQDTKISHESLRFVLDKCNNEQKVLGSFFSSDAMSELSHIFINSGFCVNLITLKSIGFYDESFFVEGVDYNLGLRALKAGLSINRYTMSGIDHTSYQEYTSVCFLGFSFKVRIYSGIRHREILYSLIRLFIYSLNPPINSAYACHFLKMFLAALIKNSFLKFLSHAT